MRVDPDLWPLTTRVDVEGRLCVGGVALNDIADQFGTPAYVLDEADFRYRIRRYRAALPGVRITYAGKALLTKQVARWVADEGLGLDVCSPAELATGLTGGVDPRSIVVHGNAKTTGELRAAANAGVGRIVIDCGTEIAMLASQLHRPQEVLIRVAPGIDIHGHAAVTTGIVDQKFGFAVAEGQAALAVRRVLDQPLLRLAGLHCHLGSQVTDPAPYGEAIGTMVALMADVRTQYGVVLTELNIGGGHGVPYVAGDGELDLDELARVIDDALDQACAAERFPRPKVVVEPGRAIAARAGLTCYRVVSVKHRPGGRTFVAVDGGMGDNPRVALYGARYTVTVANRHPLGPTQTVTVVGRNCEAGDVVANDVQLAADLHPGDLLAVACTGAYHHSMASTFNMVGRPPVVAVRDGLVRELVRRETTADLLLRDLG
ncbi:MAG: diaminopimelate decarboxylase [Mycobacterium sp.]|nr:diaminopimelate decarboxylase [Mycobacterium sp.]